MVVDDVFDQLVEQAGCRGLPDSIYRIDSTHVTAIQYNDGATWTCDSTVEEHYYGFGCVIVSAEPKIPIAPYNPRNTDDPLDIEYRVEDRLDEHTEDISLKQLLLDETTVTGRKWNEQTKPARIAALGTFRPEAASTQEHNFVALCFRVLVTITNYEQGENPGRTKLKTL